VYLHYIFNNLNIRLQRNDRWTLILFELMFTDVDFEIYKYYVANRERVYISQLTYVFCTNVYYLLSQMFIICYAFFIFNFYVYTKIFLSILSAYYFVNILLFLIFMCVKILF